MRHEESIQMYPTIKRLQMIQRVDSLFAGVQNCRQDNRTESKYHKTEEPTDDPGKYRKDRHTEEHDKSDPNPHSPKRKETRHMSHHTSLETRCSWSKSSCCEDRTRVSDR